MPGTAAIASALRTALGVSIITVISVLSLLRLIMSAIFMRRIVELRLAAADRAMAERRIAQPVGDLARLLGGVDMGDDDAERPAVEHARRHGKLAVGHAHDRRDAGILRGRRDLAGRLDRHRAVLEVEEQPVEARRLHHLDDVDVANQSHADAEGQLVLLEPRLGGIDLP